MKKLNQLTIEWLRAAAVRAIRTMAQTALSLITIGATLTDIAWTQVLSVSIVAGIFSLLTSLSTNLPEVSMDGTLEIDTSGEKDIYRLQLNSELKELAEKNHIHLKVQTGVDLSQQ